MNLENKILELYKKEYRTVKEQRIMDMLKVILVDKVNDIDTVVELTATTISTMQKYILEKAIILKFLTEPEFEIFKTRFENLVNMKLENKNKLKQQKKEARIKPKITEEELENIRKEEIARITGIINDIFNTRHKYEQICADNYYSKTKFDKIINQSDYIDEIFGPGTQKKVKDKIAENALIRLNIARDKILIESKEAVLVANENIYGLSNIDFRKLSYASCYLYNGADLQYVVNKYECSVGSVIRDLTDPKLKEILKPEYYEKLEKYVKIEKVLLGNNLVLKRELLNEVINILNSNSYDIDMALSYFKLPIALFNKLLLEIIKSPSFDESIKENIRKMISTKEEKKVK